jgi:hypothetical protein
MRFTFLIITFALIFIGCDRRKPPETVNPDLVYDTIPLYEENTSFAPYDFEKFKPVLEQSRLQIFKDSGQSSDTNNTTIDYGAFDGVKFPQFYVDTQKNLHFVISKKANTYKTRSELREGPNSWSTADTEGHFWVATLKCLKPKVGISSYTWMQIHGTKDTYNYPILRLFWERNRTGLYDHLWAVIIMSDPNSPKIYAYADLGARPSGFFTAEVHIRNNIMDILINHKLKDTINVTYWEDVQNYYKAGVYINRYGDGGTVSAIFKELHFYDDASKVVSVHH